MKISVGCDHGALALKNKLVSHLEAKGHEVKDFGTYTLASCDYPEFAAAAAKAVLTVSARRALSCAPPASVFPSLPIRSTASAARCCPMSGPPR